jgi:protein required for attachment to host cells
MNTWIVVTDASRARLFAANGHNEPPKLIKHLRHEQSRQKGSAVTSDKPGRSQRRAGPGRFSSANESKAEPKDIEATHFAHELARLLDDARNRRQFDRLAVAAPPQFLGLLRSTISPQVKKHLARCIDKDYTKEDARKLSGQLATIVADIQAEQRRKEMGG